MTAQPTTPVRLITGSPHQPVTWGVPWPRGAVALDATFALGDTPLQSWPLATWPDGSLKWSGHAVTGFGDPGEITVGDPAAPQVPVAHEVVGDVMTVSTGPYKWRLPLAGRRLLSEVVVGGTVVARDVRLVSVRQQRHPKGDADSPAREEWVGRVEKVTIEQHGPLKVVVKVTGRHVPLADTNRVRSARWAGPPTETGSMSDEPNAVAWLPYTVRLDFHAGRPDVRLVHSLVYDGGSGDVLAGLGLRADVPLREEPENRHVRLAGPLDPQSGRPGFLTEAVRGVTGLRRDTGLQNRQAQVHGLSVGAIPDPAASLMHWVPRWDQWRLEQHSPDGFTLVKRTDEAHGWVTIPGGTRSAGFAYLGDTSGGFGLGMRDFWQSYPTRLDVAGAAGDTGSLTCWLWSPSAPPMDVRSVHDGLGMEGWPDEIEAMEITYEDFEPGFGDPFGVARTHELRMVTYAATPDADTLAQDAAQTAAPAVVAAAPEHMLAAGVFGDWSLPDRSTPERAEIEDRLDALTAFYLGQRDDRRWYGFWDFGDVMHTYDRDRHQWRYDVGGFAWDNSELSPDLWLWYQFLRTGSPDVYSLAWRLTRHTGEVDVHHLGRFAGLGSRHNVRHWGCSAKQVRISSAAYRRIPYYLSADERLGDLLADLADVEETFTTLDPNRKVRRDGYVRDDRVVSVGLGTDWSALASAWLTSWERVGDERVRERARAKLLGTMADIAALPQGFLTGEGRMDMRTRRFDRTPDQLLVSHLSAVFGLAEVCSELIRLTEGTPEEQPGFADAWARYCHLFLAPPDEQAAEVGAALKGISLVQGHSRLTAWVAARTGSPDLAARAWREFSSPPPAHGWVSASHPDWWSVVEVGGPTVLQRVRSAVNISTNDAAQYGLAAIQLIALLGDPPASE